MLEVVRSKFDKDRTLDVQRTIVLLIFDARHLQRPHTGLGRYTASLLSALVEIRAELGIRLEVLICAHKPVGDAGSLLTIGHYESRGLCMVHRIDAPPFSIRHHFSVGSLVKKRRADLYFYPHFDLPYDVKVPSVFVVHDLLPLKVDGYVRRWRAAKKLYFAYAIKRGVRVAQCCYAVSQRTRTDIIGLVGQEFSGKVRVAYEGPTYNVTQFGHALAPIGVQTPYLLYVGDWRPNKNVRRIIDVFTVLRKRHGYAGTLVLAGSRQTFGFDVRKYVGTRDDIRIVGPVSDSELAALYRRTDALIFLSAYEGFGLPVVEAAVYNKKIVVSDGGSLPEVAPPSACIIPNDLSIDEAAGTVAAYLVLPIQIDNSSYLDQFSWLRAARTIFGPFCA